MDINLNLMMSQFFFPLIRSTGLILSTPFFSSQVFPVSLKIFFSMILAISITMNCPVSVSIDPFSIAGVGLLFKEALIGCMFGYCIQILFQFMIMSGNIISMQTGLGFATMNDPQTGFNFPIISQILIIASNMILLENKGDLYLFYLLKKSYSIFPIDKLISKNVFHELCDMFSCVFFISLTLSMPIIIFLLMINFSFGVISKISPQMNIISYSFPLSMILGLFLLAILLPDISSIFVDNLYSMFHLMLGANHV